jgi:hypothetical protein
LSMLINLYSVLWTLIKPSLVPVLKVESMCWNLKNSLYSFRKKFCFHAFGFSKTHEVLLQSHLVYCKYTHPLWVRCHEPCNSQRKSALGIKTNVFSFKIFYQLFKTTCQFSCWTIFFQFWELKPIHWVW